MDMISRQAAIEPKAISEWKKEFREYVDSLDITRDDWKGIIEYIDEIPSAQPEHTETHSCENQRTETHDLVSRQSAIKTFHDEIVRRRIDEDTNDDGTLDEFDTEAILRRLPSAQPERTCVNCGRTANNGGWYADGRTRCPIEEHYALPKDGFCHLWEKRNVTDDDYPERREE